MFIYHSSGWGKEGGGGRGKEEVLVVEDYITKNKSQFLIINVEQSLSFRLFVCVILPACFSVDSDFKIRPLLHLCSP